MTNSCAICTGPASIYYLWSQSLEKCSYVKKIHAFVYCKIADYTLAIVLREMSGIRKKTTT